MPGRPITDQQHRYYMTLRKTHPQKTAAAIAGDGADASIADAARSGKKTAADSAAAKPLPP